ncbi:MAG: CDP-alcohol phosphatidyltransferase family protein [Clostridiales bacterium]|nr:CDP-alcohol phosphatidyltransferase family protein [Clostridiales bacterium]
MEQKTNNMANKYEKKIITIPNILSFFRLCLIPVIVWLYNIKRNYVWAGYILILSGITDMADGYIARRFNMISNFGKVLDPIADKLTQGVMLICLLLRFPLMIAPFVLLITKEAFMGISGILIIKKTGIVCGAQWHGKAATCLLYGMMILHVFWHEITPLVSMIFIAACTLMIGISLVLYGLRNIRIMKQAKEDK